MVIENIEFPNLEWGYESTIKFPFYKNELANGRIAVSDDGITYDKYRCKGSLILTEDEVTSFYAMYHNTRRGKKVTLSDTISSGFFPFTPGVISSEGESAGVYLIYLDKINNRGQVDLLSKRFRVDFEMILASQPIYATPHATLPTEGGLVLGEGNLTVDGIRYPTSMNVNKEHNVFLSHQYGGDVFGTVYPKELERNAVRLELTCKEKHATNIVYRMLYNFRALPFKITTAVNYFIFGYDQGDNTFYNVRLATPHIQIKHTGFNQFSIQLEIVKES